MCIAYELCTIILCVVLGVKRPQRRRENVEKLVTEEDEGRVLTLFNNIYRMQFYFVLRYTNPDDKK